MLHSIRAKLRSGSSTQLILVDRWWWAFSCRYYSGCAGSAALCRGSPDRGGWLLDRAPAALESQLRFRGPWRDGWPAPGRVAWKPGPRRRSSPPWHLWRASAGPTRAGPRPHPADGDRPGGRSPARVSAIAVGIPAASLTALLAPGPAAWRKD